MRMDKYFNDQYVLVIYFCKGKMIWLDAVKGEYLLWIYSNYSSKKKKRAETWTTDNKSGRTWVVLFDLIWELQDVGLLCLCVKLVSKCGWMYFKRRDEVEEWVWFGCWTRGRGTRRVDVTYWTSVNQACNEQIYGFCSFAQRNKSLLSVDLTPNTLYKEINNTLFDHVLTHRSTRKDTHRPSNYSVTPRKSNKQDVGLWRNKKPTQAQVEHAHSR